MWDKWSQATPRRLAIISVVSIFYNCAEGAVSIVFGETAASVSLLFFGIQSLVEVISASLVVWRFLMVAPPGMEAATTLSKKTLENERHSTITVGVLFAPLTLGTVVTSIYKLVAHQQPDSSNANLIISGSALVLMLLICAPNSFSLEG